MKYIHLLQKNSILLLSLVLLFVLYIFLYKIYIPRVNAFGCFDDCFNFMGGYFLLHDKHLYSQIFYNHAPGMAYISAVIQYLTHPQNLYDLVLKHRQFVFLFGLVANIVIILRFGYWMLPAVALYELTKFYVFGDRFLAEGLIVYPLVYLAGLSLKKLQPKNLFTIDFILAGISTWFIIFMREPYVPLALFLFIVLLWGRTKWGVKTVSLFIFFFLSLVSIFYHNLPDFYFNVIRVNAQVSLQIGDVNNTLFGTGILNAFFYPFLIFWPTNSSFLHTIEFVVGALFLCSVCIFLWRRQWKIPLYVFLSLSLANLRFTPVGMQFYEAFHQLIWYGLFVFVTVYFIRFFPKLWLKLTGYGIFLLLFVYIFLSPRTFWHEKAQPYQEFIINYGRVLQVGEIVHTLSQPSDTLFLDGFDDMIYWVSKRNSTYPFSWYTSLMPAFAKYTVARSHMLDTNSPDFYYGSCLQNEMPQRSLTMAQQQHYIRLLDNNKPSCLWVKKTKIPSITQSQWDEAAKGYYTLPSQE